jgi:hypothetical protein
MQRTIFVFIFALVAIAGAASAQTQKPPLMRGADQNTDVLRHRDFAGKPCLEISGFARPHVVNPNLFDHVISANNHCIQPLKVKVCYARSDHCIRLDVPGRARKEDILGIMPAMKEFRFDFKEQF